ncbi:DUF2268 domain-containing protein [Bacillus rubiinfantis]|uniref:DUF2268 domain-containing protein n=1 Tax=Bacillus rubiinfantis TaxID=1499680 RepID=UPI0005AA2A06|nr:DUF2268 domain-containing putative Zn-dependent protease [Bacillus rubiinfantis]
MGIIRTDEWLSKDFAAPIKICEEMLPYFEEKEASEVYSLLVKFGMYRPTWQAQKNLEFMIKEKQWTKVKTIFTKYQQQWSGPDVPIFLFPLEQKGGIFFSDSTRTKAGVSFPDKMVLFLSHKADEREIEALLVHEYHHVCRLRSLNKKLNDYTLLDSLIIEGLAEYAVLQHCGQRYVANWCESYTDKELEVFWHRFIKANLKRKKTDRVHDHLLYGGGSIPSLLGYAVGYQMVREFYQTESYSLKKSFTIPSSKFSHNRNLFNTKGL